MIAKWIINFLDTILYVSRVLGKKIMFISQTLLLCLIHLEQLIIKEVQRTWQLSQNYKTLGLEVERL